jgi:hypothetical protein
LWCLLFVIHVQSWQDTYILGCATLHRSLVIENALTLCITNLLTRQVVFKCNQLNFWEQQNEYWYSFEMTSESNCEYIAGLCFYDDNQAIHFHKTVMELSQECNIQYVDSTRALSQFTKQEAIIKNIPVQVQKNHVPQKRTLDKKRSLFNAITGVFQRENSPTGSGITGIIPGRKKSIISDPSDFKHLGGVETVMRRDGFQIEMLPDHWKEVFQKAGITNTELQDKRTTRFLLKSISVIQSEQIPDESTTSTTSLNLIGSPVYSREGSLLDMTYGDEFSWDSFVPDSTTATDLDEPDENTATTICENMLDIETITDENVAVVVEETNELFAFMDHASTLPSTETPYRKSGLIPTDKLLEEIKRVNLKRVSQRIPNNLDEIQKNTFASNLSELMNARRAFIQDTDEEAYDSGDWE